MIRHRTIGGALAALVIASGAFAIRGSAQTQQPSGTDVLPALLQEVRGLRAAMEQMATSNAHAQLLVGRLQLQEGRMTSMIHRLDTVRDEKAKAQTRYDETRGSLQMMEGDHPPEELPAQDLDRMLGGLKAHVASAKAEVDRLTNEELQLTNDLAVEQARWIDINQRLDALEQSLTKR